jgi:hypothetical protein
MPEVLPILAMLMTATSATAADRAVLEQRLGAKYKLSSVNAEGDFVVTGATLVLKKGGLTGGVDPVTCVHEYKDEKISLTGASKGACTSGIRTLSKIPGINLIPGVGGVSQTAQGAAPTTRPFVPGEKLYMTKIEVAKDDINLTLISDLISQVRYRAEIRFHKAATLEVPEAENLIAEVLGVSGGGGGAAPAARPATTAAPAAAPQYAAPQYAAPLAPAAPAASAFAPIAPPAAPPADRPASASAPPGPANAALPPIAPPPPPPDQPAAAPAAISPGMTVDQVVALLGQPNKIADLGSKKIYSYPSQKVTFIDGKVTPDRDSSANQTSSIPDVLLYEIGLGVLIIGAAGFMFLRRPKAAAMAPPAPPPPPAAWPSAPPPMPPMPQAAPPAQPQTAAWPLPTTAVEPPQFQTNAWAASSPAQTPQYKTAAWSAPPEAAPPPYPAPAQAAAVPSLESLPPPSLQSAPPPSPQAAAAPLSPQAAAAPPSPQAAPAPLSPQAPAPQAPQAAAPQAPAWSPQTQSIPINPIRRLDELEKLMDLGVLSREEFEMEKDKLRSM